MSRRNRAGRSALHPARPGATSSYRCRLFCATMTQAPRRPMSPTRFGSPPFSWSVIFSRRAALKCLTRAALFLPQRRPRRDVSDVQPIGLDRVVAEELALLDRGHRSGGEIERIDPLAIGSGKLGDRPVAAVHNPVDAETFNDMVD